MAREELNPFGDLSSKRDQMDVKVVRSRDTEGANFSGDNNRGDLTRQIKELENNFYRERGYDPEEFTTNNIDSEEMELLDLLKSQYGSLEDIKKNLLNPAPVEDKSKLQLLYTKEPAVKQQTAADKLIDELLSEIEC